MIELPTFEECQQAVSSGNYTKLQYFIRAFEPQTSDEDTINAFRGMLWDALNEVKNEL